jgi:hypothetical protein
MIPYTDYECRLKLEELLRGDSIIIPADLEHAKLMLKVAQDYISRYRKEFLEEFK